MASLYEEVRSALGDSAFRPKKRLGQNFLIHERVIDSILRLLNASATDEVMEIGPGLGFLTRRLAEIVSKVWAIEIDPFLVEWLMQSSLGSHPGVQLIHGDILKIRLDDLLPQRKIKLVGNLPYSISTEVLFRIFDSHEHFSSLVLMVQKEVAERIAGQPGTKSYGTLSVWSQVHGRIVEKVQVSPEAFFPRPKVRSTILKIELFPEPLISKEELPLLRGLVRAAFGQRRKTLANALAGWLKQGREEIEGLLRAQGIDPKRRGETLSVNDFISLARAVNRRGLSATPDQELETQT
jgi:16S rRNA (adenine1518-N6/adenine1519-N6)-dimethyltransferase